MSNYKGQYNDSGIYYGFKSDKVSKHAMIRNRHNPVPHLTQDTNGILRPAIDTPVSKMTSQHQQGPLKVKEGITNASNNPNG